MPAPKLYQVKIPVERPGQKKWWLRIGSATAYRSPQDGKEGFAVTIHSIPIGWNGECYLFPVDPPKGEPGEG